MAFFRFFHNTNQFPWFLSLHSVSSLDFMMSFFWSRLILRFDKVFCFRKGNNPAFSFLLSQIQNYNTCFIWINLKILIWRFCGAKRKADWDQLDFTMPSVTENENNCLRCSACRAVLIFLAFVFLRERSAAISTGW